MIRRCLTCCVVVLLNAWSAQAQGTQTNVSNANAENDRRQVVPFLDATYVAFGRATNETTGNLIKTFEADIVPNFVIRQTFFDVLGEEETKTLLRQQQQSTKSEFRFAYSIVAVPMVKIRMFITQRSSPVRTPSYMPKGTGQFFWFKLQPRKVDLFAVQATVGHHSNGQEGCLFEIQQRESEADDADCVPDVPVSRVPEAVNRKDGSFSTNYLQFGWRYRHIRLDAPSEPELYKKLTEVVNRRYVVNDSVDREDWSAVVRAAEELRVAAGTNGDQKELVEYWDRQLAAAVNLAAKGGPSQDLRRAVIEASVALVAAATPVYQTSSRDATLGVDVEVNPGDGKFLGGGGINPNLKSRYGANRFTVLAGYARKIRACNRAELKGSGKYIHQPAEGIPSWAWSVEGQCLFRQTNWGMFTRFYSGQDYYNLGFQDNVKRLQIGMTYSQEGFLRFRSKPISADEVKRVLAE